MPRSSAEPQGPVQARSSAAAGIVKRPGRRADEERKLDRIRPRDRVPSSGRMTMVAVASESRKATRILASMLSDVDMGGGDLRQAGGVLGEGSELSCGAGARLRGDASSCHLPRLLLVGWIDVLVLYLVDDVGTPCVAFAPVSPRQGTGCDHAVSCLRRYSAASSCFCFGLPASRGARRRERCSSSSRARWSMVRQRAAITLEVAVTERCLERDGCRERLLPVCARSSWAETFSPLPPPAARAACSWRPS